MGVQHPSLVVAELRRRGVVATNFAGNVPSIDILAYRDGRSTAQQLKSVRSGLVSFDAKRFLTIEFEGNKQIIAKQGPALDGALSYVFVSIGQATGVDRFFILEQRDCSASYKRTIPHFWELIAGYARGTRSLPIPLSRLRSWMATETTGS